MIETSVARGIRNNNPGNIRKSKDAWIGLASVQMDEEFCTFESAEYGIRAMVVLLLGYAKRHGLNTIAGIIRRWAPAVENNTAAYISSISQQTGFAPDQPLELRNEQILTALISAIIAHENGINPYSSSQIQRGLELAGIKIKNQEQAA